jgi:hypothetical protein
MRCPRQFGAFDRIAGPESIIYVNLSSSKRRDIDEANAFKYTAKLSKNVAPRP